MWAQTYDENNAENSASYCEMCGAELFDGVPDRRNASRAAEALSMIAHMYVEDPQATGIMLRKIVNPYESQLRIAKAEKCSQPLVCMKLKEIAERYPDLIEILGFKSKASISQNRLKQDGPRSAYRGVTWHSQRKRWQVQIAVDKRIVYCGVYEDETEAAKAYNEAATRLLGSKANLNRI